jgi:histidinol-phosphate aminotransferase
MPELALAELLRPELGELSAYLPVQGEFDVRLDANEAPALLSDHARGRLAEVAAATAWHRYPDATALQLRTAIAERCGVTPDEVLVGVGSDEVITLLLTVLSRPRDKSRNATLLTTTPTFVMYRMSARVRGLAVVEVPLDGNWDLSADSMLRAIEMSQPNLIFIASPNNPTANLMSRDRLERVVEAAGGALVVLDEAYVDYSKRDQLDLYRRHENVAVLRTLSKVGFAALRIGWLLARSSVIAELDKARLPYNVTSLSQELGTLVLTELSSELDRITRSVASERERVRAELDTMGRCQVAASDANFLWFRTERAASEVFSELGRRSVLVRSFHQRGGRLAHQLRVTIGAPADNDRFLAAASEVL